MPVYSTADSEARLVLSLLTASPPALHESMPACLSGERSVGGQRPGLCYRADRSFACAPGFVRALWFAVPPVPLRTPPTRVIHRTPPVRVKRSIDGSC